MTWRSVEGYPAVRYRVIDWAVDGERVQGLFQQYRQWIADHADTSEAATDRVRQGLSLLDGLIGRLPETYGPPNGDILLWYEKDDLIACGAIRPVAPGIGELKRVYIRDDYRGEEFGKPFVRAHIARARELGLQRLRSYALGSMTSAIDFYQELGFRRIPAYWTHPASGTVFFERDLGNA